MATQHIFLPQSHARLRALTRAAVVNRISGRGAPSFLLDGGIGGQSSYNSIEDYENTTGRNLSSNKMGRSQAIPAHQSGQGLADRIASKLSKLSLEKPKKTKKKNIVMSF